MRSRGFDSFRACSMFGGAAIVVGAACLQLGCNGGRGAAPTDAGIDATFEAGVDSGLCIAFDAASLDDAEVALGQSIVTQLDCEKCHGSQYAGSNDGVASPTTVGGVAYPPNLTPDPRTGLGCWTNAQIENAFLSGIDNEGATLCPPMPHFADAGVTPAGADAIVAFLRSLPPIVAVIPDTPDCPTIALDAGEDGSEIEGDAAGDASATGAGDASATDGGDVDAGMPGGDSSMHQDDAASDGGAR